MKTSPRTVPWATLLLLLLAGALGCGPPPAAPPAPPAARPPAPTGVFTVRNDTIDPLALRLDGVIVGALRPGGSYRSGPIPVGRHRLRAEHTALDVAHDYDIEVFEGAEIGWRILQLYGTLRLANPNAFPVAIELAGAPRGRLGPGEGSYFDRIPVGRRDVIIRGPDGGVLLRRTLTFRAGELVQLALDQRRPPPTGAPPPVVVPVEPTPGGPPAGRPPAPVHVPAASAALVVTSSWGVAATVRLGERVLGTVPPHGRSRFEGLPAGRHRIRAERPEGLPRAGLVELVGGRTAEWSVPADAQPDEQ